VDGIDRQLRLDALDSTVGAAVATAENNARTTAAAENMVGKEWLKWTENCGVLGDYRHRGSGFIPSRNSQRS
jgi:hypothetical protein